MIFIYGHRMYGKVDRIPGVGHVVTRFGHLNYVPLFPMGSFLVVQEQGDQFIGAPIGLNGKSILTTYLRAAGWLGAIIGAVVLAISIADGRGSGVSQAVIVSAVEMLAAAGVLALTYLLPWFHTASQERADKLMKSAAQRTEQGRQIMQIVLQQPVAMPGHFPVISAGGNEPTAAPQVAQPPPARPAIPIDPPSETRSQPPQPPKIGL